MSVRELTNEIIVSLYVKGATFEELTERDFLKNKSKYGIQVLIRSMIRCGFIYETKKGKLKAYKKISKLERFKEYEL